MPNTLVGPANNRAYRAWAAGRPVNPDAGQIRLLCVRAKLNSTFAAQLVNEFLTIDETRQRLRALGLGEFL